MRFCCWQLWNPRTGRNHTLIDAFPKVPVPRDEWAVTMPGRIVLCRPGCTRGILPQRLRQAVSCAMVLAMLVLAIAPTVAALSAPVRPDTVARLAAEINSGRITDKVLEELGGLLKNNPRDARLHFLAGQAYDHLGYRELANGEYDVADKLDPARSEAALEIFSRKIETEDIAGAFQYLHWLAQRYPQAPAVLLMQGLMLQYQGKLLDAERVLRQALQSKQAPLGVATALADVLGHEALSLEGAKRAAVLQEALGLVQQDLSRRSDHFRANRVAAEILLVCGRPGEAAFHLEKCASKQPSDMHTVAMLAVLYERAGNYAGALEAALVQLALSTNPQALAGSRYEVAQLVRRVRPEQVDAAVARVDRRLSRTPYAARLHFALGSVFDRLNQPTRAAVQYRAGLALEPDYARGWMRLGKDMLDLHRYDLALLYLTKAFELEPGNFQIASAQERCKGRLGVRNRDLSWRLKDWLQSLFMPG
jgi:tetratricopeptide (TPR) repeat protein